MYPQCIASVGTRAATASWSTGPVAVGPPLDVVMLLGFLAMLATILCWWEGRRSSGARFALGCCLVATAAYAFAAGAWPLGVLQIAAACAAFGSWRSGESRNPRQMDAIRAKLGQRQLELFGPTYCDN